ncbi:7323_t:CDS:1, partial [Gigaspora rosea]
NCIANSKLLLHSISNWTSLPRPGIPNTIDIENYISWDYAEAVHIPYSSQQEGATYFKSLYKIEVFGICEEAVPYH